MTGSRRSFLSGVSRTAGLAGVLGVGTATGLAGCAAPTGDGVNDDEVNDDGVNDDEVNDDGETDNGANGDGGTDDDGTPTSPTPPEPDPRVDEPPHDVEEPDAGSGGEDWDEEYLCRGIDAEPTVAFETAVTTGSAGFGDLDLDFDDRKSSEEYFAALLTDADAYERLDEGLRDRLGAPDFDAEAVLVVQTGWGSSSVRPEVVRIEPTNGGVHVHGCHVDPFVQTDDVTVRTLAVRFDRPDGGLDAGATVSLTVAPDRRVHFAAGEGVVSL